MKESSFKLQNALDGIYLSVTLNEPVQLDTIAVKVMKEDCPDFFVPFQMVTMNDDLSLKYRLTNAVALSYINTTFTRDAFIRFFMELLKPFLNASDWFMDYHYICINTDYVYMNKNMADIKYIYIPEHSYANTDEDIVNFLRKILDKITIVDDEAILVPFYQYFNRNQVVLPELYQMLQKNKDRASVSTVSQTAIHQEAQPVKMTGSAVSYGKKENNLVPQQQAEPQPKEDKVKKSLFDWRKEPEKKQEKKPAEPKNEPMPADSRQPFGGDSNNADVMDALFGDPKKKDKAKKEKKEKVSKPEKKESHHFDMGSLFNKKKENPLEQMIQPQQQIQRQPESVAPRAEWKPDVYPGNFVPDDGSTDIFGEDDSTVISGMATAGTACLELVESVRQGAIRRISLDFSEPFITIGRQSNDAVQPTISFDKSFKNISRMHLRIEKRGSELYAIDLGSANHTFLNGRQLIPNQAYGLKSDMELTFAVNEPVRYRVVL